MSINTGLYTFMLQYMLYHYVNSLKHFGFAGNTSFFFSQASFMNKKKENVLGSIYHSLFLSIEIIVQLPYKCFIHFTPNSFCLS